MTFRYRLVTCPRWLGWMFGPVLNAVFRHDTQKRLAALKQAVEERHLLQASAEVTSE